MRKDKSDYKIIIMGGYHPLLDRIVASFKNIEVLYYIKDETVLDNFAFEKFWDNYGAKRAELKEEYLKQVDMVFVCGYTKIIKSNLLNKFLFVNIHAGNLPKWRGTSANSWSILNGDYNIAYTLHRVTDELDGGGIYKKFEYSLRDNEKYGDGRKKLEHILEKELENAFINICNGEIRPIEQKGKYSYCNSFRKEDGIINDWNVETRRIIDLFRVFGTPYGSGLYFIYKGKEYEIMDVSADESYRDYYCTLGAVVNASNQSVWIKTKDNVVKINNIKNADGEIMKASALLKIGNRL